MANDEPARHRTDPGSGTDQEDQSVLKELPFTDLGPDGSGVSDEYLWGEALPDVPQAARGDASQAPALIATDAGLIPPRDLAGDGDLVFSAYMLTPAAVAGADLAHDLAHDLCEAGVDHEALIAAYRQLLPFLAGSASPRQREEFLTAFAICARQLVIDGLLNGQRSPGA